MRTPIVKPIVQKPQQIQQPSQFDVYQVAAMSTRLPSADETYAVLGLAGEVGELHSAIAKHIRDGDLDDADQIVALQNNVAKELGDILWFIAAIADDFNISLSTIATMNLKKLAKRQAEGSLGGSGDER
jgi:NTP pyrophosphatase (non-canonical NTP hydrolase)